MGTYIVDYASRFRAAQSAQIARYTSPILIASIPGSRSPRQNSQSAGKNPVDIASSRSIYGCISGCIVNDIVPFLWVVSLFRWLGCRLRSASGASHFRGNRLQANHRVPVQTLGRKRASTSARRQMLHRRQQLDRLPRLEDLPRRCNLATKTGCTHTAPPACIP